MKNSELLKYAWRLATRPISDGPITGEFDYLLSISDQEFDQAMASHNAQKMPTRRNENLAIAFFLSLLGWWSVSTILTARRQLSWPVESGE